MQHQCEANDYSCINYVQSRADRWLRESEQGVSPRSTHGCRFGSMLSGVCVSLTAVGAWRCGWRSEQHDTHTVSIWQGSQGNCRSVSFSHRNTGIWSMPSKGFTGREAGQRCCLARCSTFQHLECTLVNQAGLQNLYVHQRKTAEQGTVGIWVWFRKCSHCVPVEIGGGGMASAFACLSMEMSSEWWIFIWQFVGPPKQTTGFACLFSHKRLLL